MIRTSGASLLSANAGVAIARTGTAIRGMVAVLGIYVGLGVASAVLACKVTQRDRMMVQSRAAARPKSENAPSCMARPPTKSRRPAERLVSADA